MTAIGGKKPGAGTAAHAHSAGEHGGNIFDPELLDRCISCGFCLPACPTYALTSDEGSSPRGRITLMRALETGRLDPDDDRLQKEASFCLGCRACEPVCPAGVQYGHLLETWRDHQWRGRHRPPLAQVLMMVVDRKPLVRLIEETPRERCFEMMAERSARGGDAFLAGQYRRAALLSFGSIARWRRSDGARVVSGGGRPPGLERGWYVEPTLFADVDNSMRIAQEEIFGPVLSVIGFDDDDDAVRIANDSIYGLSGVVFADDLERAKGVAGRIRTGTLGINGGLWYGADAPFGGYKQSGIGRQCGIEGLEIFTETKTVGWPAS